MSGLQDLIRERRIIVCCGSGGVGKTTTAAAIAVEGARLGRRTCVVTIDPARRLADALGLDSLTNAPCRVDGAWPGELWALMLDTRSTFDEAIVRYARNEAQAQMILKNRVYRNLCDSLSGTQEYMAVEKLYDLDQESDFELIVVDTPPASRAVEFINAPRHLTRLIDNPALRLLVMPSRVYVRVVAIATQTWLKAASKVVGAEMVLDTVSLLRAFEGMEAGIGRRAERVLELFAEPSTAFVLVVGPRQDVIEEGRHFAEHLDQSDIRIRALIVNRLHPRFDAWPGATSPFSTDEKLDGAPMGENALALTVLRRNWTEMRAVSEREERHVKALAEQLAPALVARVPLLARDVHDLEGVQAVANHLSG